MTEFAGIVDCTLREAINAANANGRRQYDHIRNETSRGVHHV